MSSPSVAARPRRPAHERPSEGRILEAAEKLFARRGFGDVSLRQLLAAAGVSTTAFYARFESKEAVLSALAARFFAELLTRARGSLGPVRDFDEGIQVSVDVLVDYLAEHRSLVRLIVAESGQSTPTLAARRQAYGILIEFLAGQIGTATRGALDPPRAHSLAWAVVGALEMQIVRWAVWEELELEELRHSLKATARVMLPEVPR